MVIDVRMLQYKKNKMALQSLQESKFEHYDWIVTITFYAALHLVHSKLVNLLTSEEARKIINHDSRNDYVCKQKKLGKEVARLYKALYNSSRSARYNCTSVSEESANEAKRNLEVLENELSNTLKS